MNKLLKQIAKGMSKIDGVLSVILYGSFARQEATSRSDIDLLILIKEQGSAIKVEDEIIKLEKEIGRAIQPTIRVLRDLDKTDSGLMQNIFQEGKILYLREPLDMSSSLLFAEKPFLIYTFKISNLSQNKKAKFNNELYRRTKGRYSYEGLLEEVGGGKLSSGCVLVPYAKREKIEKLFKKLKVGYANLKVWR